MAEGVFTLTADITPQVDQKALQQQANQLQRQLNGILSKNLKPVEIQGNTRAFQQQIEETSNVISRTLRTALDRARGGVSNLVDTGRRGFLGFTNAIRATRDNITQYSTGVVDAIKNNSLFERTLETVKERSDSLRSLPDTFADFSAQVESGFTPLQQAAAAGGGLFAQMGASLEKSGAIANTELAGIGGTLDRLIIAVNRFAAASTKTFDATANDADLLAANVNNLESPFFRVQAILNATGTSASKFGENLRATFAGAAGDPEKLTQALIALRDENQKIAGPLGIFKRLLGEVTAAEREAAKATRLELNASLIELGQGESVQGLQRLAARFALLRQDINEAGQTIRNAGRLIDEASLAAGRFATRLPLIGKPLQDIGRLAEEAGIKGKIAFDTFLGGLGRTIGSTFATARSAIDNFASAGVGRLNAALRDVGGGAGFVGAQIRSAFVDPAIQSFNQLTTAAGTLARTLANDLGQGVGFIGGQLRSTFQGLGGQIVQDLSNGIQAARGALGNLGNTLVTGIANSIRSAGRGLVTLGQDIVIGLRNGITGASSALLSAARAVGNVVLGALRRVFRSASPSKAAEDEGHNFIAGLAKGLLATGPVRKAAEAIIGAVRSIPSALAGIAQAAGVALAGLGATAITAGIQFNTLQQVINATLPVLVGSSEASDQLLASINELNDSSPFARSAFLELTRVLAGFGLEAEKIPGTIDAIQQTIAATGGGEQDLLELGQAFARLQSQGRLSLDILQSFSSRGVDAIAILGQGFNKTTTEVRKMISDGLIPADKAIEILTTGLKDRFDGATEAVSKNLPGALDRIRAKMRDLGAALTRAFVNPEGGGALVDLLNALSTAVGAATKIIVPVFAPALQKVADLITQLSQKVTDLITPLTRGTNEISAATNAIKPFIEQLSGLSIVVAGLAGAFPALLGFLPVIGPLLASIGGPGGAAIGVLVALIATSKELQNAFKGLFAGVKEGPDAFQGIGGAVADILPKISQGVQAISTAVAPFIATFVSKLGPVIQAISTGIGELVDEAIIPFAESFGTLLKSAEPFLDILKNVAIIVIQVFFARLKNTIAVLRLVAEALAFVFNALKGPIESIRVFVEELRKSEVIKTIFESVGVAINAVADNVVGAFNIVISSINFVIRQLQRLPKFLQPGFIEDLKELEQLKIGGDSSEFEGASKAVKEGLKDQVKEAKNVEKALTDAYRKAGKEAEQAEAKVGQLTDQLRQQLQTATQEQGALFDAARAASDASRAVGDARRGVAEATANQTQIEKDYARALRDVITPSRELSRAERELGNTRRSLLALDREELDIQKELRQLRGEDANDKRAALDRAIERAKIALNQARRDELELQKEGQKTTSAEVNLAGLSLDQVRSRLANARLSLQAQKASNTLTGQQGKTQQQIDDERKSAALDVADAVQAEKDAVRARAEFELSTSNSIRDNEERLLEISGSREELRITEEEQLTHINDLRAGETAQQRIIEDFDKRIADAKKQIEAAQQRVTDAISKSTEASLKLKEQTAIIKGDIQGQADAAFALLAHKRQGLKFDQETETALKNQLATVQTIAREIQAAQAAATAAALELQKAARTQFGQALANEQLLTNQAREASDRGEFLGEGFLKALEGADDFFREALTNLFTSQSVVNREGAAVVFNAAQINDLLMGISDAQAFNPNLPIRDILKEILRKIGLSIPGFARGTAPGEYIRQGKNDGKGLVRMFEYGKEAVLPLTRAADMVRVVNNPQVLPKILNALKLDIPGFTHGTAPGEQLSLTNKFEIPKAIQSPTALPKILDALPRISLTAVQSNLDTQATILPRIVNSLPQISLAAAKSGSDAKAGLDSIKSVGVSSRPATSNIADKKQEQKELALAISSAVKSAMKEALSETGSLGADVDINVHPTTDNHILIAQEVRRQVKKALGDM